MTDAHMIDARMAEAHMADAHIRDARTDVTVRPKAPTTVYPRPHVTHVLTAIHSWLTG